jgi:hypothetical protein
MKGNKKMFNNIIVYGYENDKLWFGRVSLWSWLMAFFINGRLIAVKPIKGYERYAYYPKVMLTSLDGANITNYHPRESSPIHSIALAERRKGGIKTTFSIH